jgi:hypothetical protein
MIDDVVKLGNIARSILAPAKRLADLLPEAHALRDFFETSAGFRIDAERGIGDGETRLESGLAISPTAAALCVRELFRTTAFVRGLGNAINDLLRPDRPVRVLYAGCGPYASLAVPLMAVFSREQASFTLLDIHQNCLDDASKLIDSLGFSDRVDGSFCADATRFRIPPALMPDIIVSETMSVTLHNEPQVAIERNLLAQAPDAVMVPERVSVELCTLRPGKEHVFMPADFVGEFPAPERDRVHLGKLFDLDAASVLAWQGVDGDRLPAGRVRVPDSLEGRTPYLLTRICVYGDTCLNDYDCSLTIPRRVRDSFTGGEELQFHYQLGAHPELRYERLAVPA